MPIHLGAGMVDDDFWEEERRQEVERMGPEFVARVEAARAEAAMTAAARDAAARMAGAREAAASMAGRETAAERAAERAAAAAAGQPLPPPGSIEPLSSPFPPALHGVRDRFLARVAQTRSETGRPLHEIQGELTGSDAELVSYLRVSSEAMRVALLATVSEPWPEGSDEEVMAKILREAIEHAGSRVPSVELPRGRKREREADPPPGSEVLNADGAESHEQLRNDIAAIEDCDKMVRSKLNALNEDIHSATDELKALEAVGGGAAEAAARRAILLKEVAALQRLAVQRMKQTREYAQTAQDIFEATAIRWVLDFADYAVAWGKTTASQRRRCLSVGKKYIHWDTPETIHWDNVPNSVKALLKNHGMDWCNSVVFEVFQERGSKIEPRTYNPELLSVGRTEKLCLAIRPADRRAGEDAELGELRFNNPESSGYAYQRLHHGRKVEFDACMHDRTGRVHFTPETKRPYIMVTARLVGDLE